MNVKNFNVYVKKDNKKIISDMNLNIKKDEMLTILGPSGSGKTTLLDFMTSSFPDTLVHEGEFEIFGLIKIMKYVSQEEKLHGFFTVRKYLQFFFRLNYGNEPTEEVENEVVESLAEACGLGVCIDTIVGDMFFKGLSGGQKRRLSIALEIISKPDIIIIDEPTSGLDSYSSLKLMELFRDLSKWGVCVVCTIHQPSSEIWAILDKVLFMAKGKTCYLGEASKASKFFEYLNKPVPKGYNAADHILTQINNDFDPDLDLDSLNKSFLEWKDNQSKSSSTKKIENTSIIQNQTQKFVDNTEINKINDQTLNLIENNQGEISGKKSLDVTSNINNKNQMINNYTSNVVLVEDDKNKFIKKSFEIQMLNNIKDRANSLSKFFSILKRSFLNLIKNPGIFGVRIFMYIMLCIMIGILYINLGDKKTDADIGSRSGMLFYCDAFLVFMSIAVLPFYIQDREIVSKEINNGLYRPFHYLISQLLIAFLGIFVISIISTILVILITGVNGFWTFFLILFISLLVAESMCKLVSLIIPYYIIAMALVSGMYGMFMLTEGFLIIKKDIPGYLIWIYYIGFHTYSFEAFMFNEFNSIETFESDQFKSGKAVLQFYSMDDTKIWKDCLVILAWWIMIEIGCHIIMIYKHMKKSYFKIKQTPNNKNIELKEV